MKLLFRRWATGLWIAAIVALALIAAQDMPSGPPPAQNETRLPNGKLQRDEILKAEHEQNLKDAAQLVDMAEQLQQELEKNDRYVLSLSTLKKTDDIEKLVRKIRTRLRHS